jgi:hypothetical protein
VQNDELVNLKAKMLCYWAGTQQKSTSIRQKGESTRAALRPVF